MIGLDGTGLKAVFDCQKSFSDNSQDTSFHLKKGDIEKAARSAYLARENALVSFYSSIIHAYNEPADHENWNVFNAVYTILAPKAYPHRNVRAQSSKSSHYKLRANLFIFLSTNPD